MKAYNVYGVKIVVDDRLAGAFDKEYSIFKIDTNIKNEIEQEIMILPSNDDLPVKRLRDRKGALLLLDNYPQKVTVYVNPGNGMDSYASWLIRPFMNWKNKAFMHAAAVAKKGQSIIFTGRGGVGKTILAIGFAQRGYTYLGDDWVIVSSDAVTYSFPTALSIYRYHLNILKPIKDYVVKRPRLYIKLLAGSAAAKIISSILPNAPVSRISYVKIMPQEALPNLKLGVDHKGYKLKSIVYVKKANDIDSPKLRKADSSIVSALPRILAGIWGSEYMYGYKAYILLKSLGITYSKQFEHYQDKLEKIYTILLDKVKDNIYVLYTPQRLHEYQKVIDLIEKELF